MFFYPIKGIIALDIDGTLTATTHELDKDVINALIEIEREGWRFIFITGRSFQSGLRVLGALPFSYALGVQNGALLLEMPSRKVLSRKYLSKEMIPLMEAIGEEQKTDFAIYSGLENDDWCYYRPSHLPPSMQSYALQRAISFRERWEPLQSFLDLPISLFPAMKFFAKEEQAFTLSDAIEKKLGLPAPPNRDPFHHDYFVIQATHQEATKGHVLQDFVRLMKHPGPIIAAGDDYNDYSMLQIADVKIVMVNAPGDLIKIADIVAPPASQNGIIQGLKEAADGLCQGKFTN